MMDEDTQLFVISVAAKLASMHPQTLRQYDRIGLVSPRRTSGHSRRYSMRDIVQLREVQRLSAEGVSLEGIRRILDLENQVHELQGRVAELEEALGEAVALRRGMRVFAAGSAGDVVERGTVFSRDQRRVGEIVLWRPGA